MGGKLVFCRNCANQMDPLAVVCVRCGVPKGVGSSYCPNCGAPTEQGAVYCVRCGAALNSRSYYAGNEQKSKIAAGLLGIFLGAFGVHNFYLGYTGKAVAQVLITVLSLGILSGISAIWGLVEGIMILADSIAYDADGIPLRD